MCSCKQCNNCFVQYVSSPCAESGQDVAINDDGNFTLGGTDTGVSAEASEGEDGVGVVSIVSNPAASLSRELEITFSDGTTNTVPLPIITQEFTDVGTGLSFFPSADSNTAQEVRSMQNGLWTTKGVDTDDSYEHNISFGEPRRVENLRFHFMAVDRTSSPNGRTGTAAEQSASFGFKYNTSTGVGTISVDDDSGYEYYQNIVVNKANVYITWRSPYLMVIDYDIDFEFTTGLEAGDGGLGEGEAGVGFIDFPDYVYEINLGFDAQNVDSGYAVLANSYPFAGTGNDGLKLNDTSTCFYTEDAAGTDEYYTRYNDKQMFQVRCGVNESVYPTMNYTNGNGLPLSQGSPQLLITHRYYDGVDFGTDYRFKIRNQVLSNPIGMASDYMTP